MNKRTRKKIDKKLIILNLKALEKNILAENPSGAFTIRQALRLLEPRIKPRIINFNAQTKI